MEVHILDDFSLLIQANLSRHFSIRELCAVHLFVRSLLRCCLSCDGLQQSHTLHKIGLVLPVPHMSPVAAPEPSHALWCGFDLAHMENSTKSC